MTKGTRLSPHLGRPVKKARLSLDDTSSEQSDDSNSSSPESPHRDDEGADHVGFTVNEDYARRYEHNKKREELHRLEEKHGASLNPSKVGFRRSSNPDLGDDRENRSDSDDSSSTSQEEDDDGLLATEQLDNEIAATLNAIKAKDPRVYDKDSTFYSEIPDESVVEQEDGRQGEKPMFLKDYHRKNLLEGYVGDGDGEDIQEWTGLSYAEEQNGLKRRILDEVQSAAANKPDDASGGEESDGEGNDGFFVRKNDEALTATSLSKPKLKPVFEDTLAEADKDPDSFLSGFMSSRAWVPTPTSRFQPFESDDEEEDKRAELFEEAYNLRFENPSASNEKLLSHARDAAAKYSVRKDKPTGRRKARESEREQKEAAQREIKQEKARLRKLKIEEVEEKIKKIKDAAGLRGKLAKEEDWTSLLEEGWDDARWEEEMNTRFGDAYYAENEADSLDRDPEDSHRRDKKLRKPKWDEDIDIKDLIPEFREDESTENPDITVSDAENPERPSHPNGDGPVVEHEGSAQRRKKDGKQERSEQKRIARKERRKAEELADASLELETFSHKFPKKQTRFRYRETSPINYGLTPRDILLASDSQLNQYAGLKKFATFRDAEKKQRDKKRLGKKARLRQWRKETFGYEDEPTTRFDEAQASPDVHLAQPSEPSNGETTRGKKKRKRSKMGKETASVN
ncbi:MAG: KRRI-Interacting protein 1 [Sclerophora amabilis]|nr:MAG: KRRI-Interacting protein 1 [Sclerophora amabilis]